MAGFGMDSGYTDSTEQRDPYMQAILRQNQGTRGPQPNQNYAQASGASPQSAQTQPATPAQTTGTQQQPADLTSTWNNYQAPQASQPTPGQPNINWGGSQDDLTNQLNDFFTSRGVATTETPYWAGKAQELTQRGQQIGDPNYANMRLSMADILGGPRYGGGGGGAGAGSAGLYQSNWTPDPRSSQLYDMLMGRASQSLKIDQNDPIIHNQTDAFRNEQTRNERGYLADLAEQAGGNSNISQETRLANEQVGQATSAYQAQLMGQELGARRQEIAQALASMGSMLSDQQRMQLQQQLALMDNALQQAGLSQRAYEFDSSDEFRRSPLAGGNY